MLKYKLVLIKNLSKSGLKAKFNSKDSFWRPRAKGKSSIALCVSRTPCPLWAGSGGRSLI